jgi:hypothetical protein
VEDNLVTFKDLKKRVTLESAQQTKLSERLVNKPFWIWNIQEHRQEDIKADGDCCFNDVIGLPQKDGIDKPLYDYERLIFDSLVTRNSNKHIHVVYGSRPEEICGISLHVDSKRTLLKSCMFKEMKMVLMTSPQAGPGRVR